MVRTVRSSAQPPLCQWHRPCNCLRRKCVRCCPGASGSLCSRFGFYAGGCRRRCGPEWIDKGSARNPADARVINTSFPIALPQCDVPRFRAVHEEVAGPSLVDPTPRFTLCHSFSAEPSMSVSAPLLHAKNIITLSTEKELQM